MAAELVIDYFNYQHGGRHAADYHGNGGAPDPAGLAREMARGDGWPAVLVMGEGDRWELTGGAGGWEAAAAMHAAGGPAYVPLFCSLPRQWGPFAPVIFVDPQQMLVRRWYDPRLPDFAARNRNVLIATLPGRDDWFRVCATHGDIHSEDQRLADARTFDRLANPATPTLIDGDWNSVPSYAPAQLGHWSRWTCGPDWAGPHRPDTRALDYLIGYWDETQQRRVGGIGFFDAAELAGDTTGTNLGGPENLAIGRVLVNTPWRDRLVSYQVYPALDPPVSDHLRVRVVLEV